jgi:hypothetical protein
MAVNGEDYRTRPVFDPEAHGLSRKFRYIFSTAVRYIVAGLEMYEPDLRLKILKKLEGNQNFSGFITSTFSDLKSSKFLYGLPDRYHKKS